MKTWIPIYFVAYTTRLLATFGSTHPHSTRFPYIFRNSDPNAEIFQISSSEKSTTHFFLVHWDKMMKLPWKKACKNAFDFFERHYNLGQMDKTPRKPLFWKKVDRSFLGVGCCLTTHKCTHTQNTQPTLWAALNTQFTHHTPAHPLDRKLSIKFPSLDSRSILLHDRVLRKHEVDDLG